MAASSARIPGHENGATIARYDTSGAPCFEDGAVPAGNVINSWAYFESLHVHPDGNSVYLISRANLGHYYYIPVLENNVSCSD